MEKRVLLIGHGKSFMVNAIEKGLEKEGYGVLMTEPERENIEDMENRPNIYLLYMGDLAESDHELLEYLNDAIDSERFLLYIIGNKEELDLAINYIAKEKVQEMYLRPLDVKLITENLNSVVEYSEIDDELKKKILIIDDDGTMLRMMRTWLSVKYHVYMASSGKIALSFLAKNPIDLVLLDYEMPGMDGATVLKEIRNTPAYKMIFLLFSLPLKMTRRAL